MTWWAIEGSRLARRPEGIGAFTVMFDAGEPLVSLRFEGSDIILSGASGARWRFDTVQEVGRPELGAPSMAVLLRALAAVMESTP
jgi:hypothetical protein